jgi:hypothetical protein
MTTGLTKALFGVDSASTPRVRHDGYNHRGHREHRRWYEEMRLGMYLPCDVAVRELAKTYSSARSSLC